MKSFLSILQILILDEISEQTYKAYKQKQIIRLRRLEQKNVVQWRLP